MAQLRGLTAGQPIPFGGDRVTEVPPALAEAFRPGDKLIVVDATGDLLHVPADVVTLTTAAVDRAVAAFARLGSVPDAAVTDFFDRFAARLADDEVFSAIAAANADDVERARSRGRSTTRLVLDETMRQGMIDGLRLWRDAPSGRDGERRRIEHDGWTVSERTAGLGVVGFVFEGRPNVFADACGVLRSGNAVVFRIGSDALGTARAIVAAALDPALAEAGLPAGTASLVASAERSAGHALFHDRRLSLAVARGSGAAVAQLGAVARQAGIAVSLHGTGGAWMVTGEGADTDRLRAVVRHSLDRKVCNTLNTIAVLRHRADEFVPVVLDGLAAAAAGRGAEAKLHVVGDAADRVPSDWRDRRVTIGRAEGPVTEPQVEALELADLGREWEWEDSPEVTLVLVDDVAEAVALFAEHSPRFVASLVSDDAVEQEAFWSAIDAPFVGDGFTRWVDGQYALDAPELGLSNWEGGRLFGRGGVLSGDSVFTVRTRVTQTDPDLHR